METGITIVISCLGGFYLLALELGGYGFMPGEFSLKMEGSYLGAAYSCQRGAFKYLGGDAIFKVRSQTSCIGVLFKFTIQNERYQRHRDLSLFPMHALDKTRE